MCIILQALQSSLVNLKTKDKVHVIIPFFKAQVDFLRVTLSYQSTVEYRKYFEIIVHSQSIFVSLSLNFRCG
jgi:hypothetical protein